MRFSNELRKAINKGVKQGKYRLYDLDWGRRCALGAVIPDNVVDADIAWWAHVNKYGNESYERPPTEDFLSSTYPELCTMEDERDKPCPECSMETATYNGVITHLNDEHDWTFEQIADWYDETFPTIERVIEMAGRAVEEAHVKEPVLV